MKNRVLISCCLLAAILFSCTSDEFRTFDYPRIKTLEVLEVSAEKATLRAQLEYMGATPIISSGFMWSESEVLDENASHYIEFLGYISEDDIYTYTIDGDFKVNQSFYVRAFVKTDEHVVYGNIITFKRLN